MSDDVTTTLYFLKFVDACFLGPSHKFHVFALAPRRHKYKKGDSPAGKERMSESQPRSMNLKRRCIAVQGLILPLLNLSSYSVLTDRNPGWGSLESGARFLPLAGEWWIRIWCKRFATPTMLNLALGTAEWWRSSQLVPLLSHPCFQLRRFDRARWQNFVSESDKKTKRKGRFTGSPKSL